MEESITIYPARLRGSQKRVPNGTMVYWITTLCLLTDKRFDSPTRGCIITGNAPMTFEEWRLEMGFHKSRDGQRHWDILFRCGAFEWHDVGSQRYVHLYGFERNQNRERRGIYASQKRQQRLPVVGIQQQEQLPLRPPLTSDDQEQKGLY